MLHATVQSDAIEIHSNTSDITLHFTSHFVYIALLYLSAFCSNNILKVYSAFYTKGQGWVFTPLLIPKVISGQELCDSHMLSMAGFEPTAARR